VVHISPRKTKNVIYIFGVESCTHSDIDNPNELAIIYSIPQLEKVHHIYKIGSSSDAMQCIVKMAKKSEVIQFGMLKCWMLECPGGIAEYFE
jgi:hypothetical protein